MKKLFIIIIAAASIATLAACTAGTAENADLTNRYLPDGVEFINSERDDGFTEYNYSDAEGGKYTLLVDASDNVRALEYDSKKRSGAEQVILTEEDALAIITADRPEAQLVSAVQDRDDGRWEWDLMINDGDEVGFFQLDAATGDILEYDVFYSGGNPVDPAAILEAQLAGTTITEISIDSDNGRIVFDGEAATSRGIVEFSIDADTGTVLEFEFDD